MAEVPRKATPVAESDVVRLLPGAFADAGLPLTREAARLFLGLVFLENKRGAGLYNHNWGNLAAGATWKGDLWRPEWYRQSDIDAMPEGTRKTRLQDLHNRMGRDVPSAFRAYPTSDAGLKAFAALFRAQRYAVLLEAANTGKPAEFAAAVKASGYTPDLDVVAHTASYTALVREFERADYFLDLPSSAPSAGSTLPVAAVPAVLSLSELSKLGGIYVPLAFEGNPEGSIHVARLKCAFKLQELEAIGEPNHAGALLDVRAKIGGKLYSCLPGEAAVPVRVFTPARTLWLPRMAPGDEIAIYVGGSVAAFVGWGEVD